MVQPTDLNSLRSQLAAALPEGWSLRDEACNDSDVTFLAALYSSTREDELAVVPWPQTQKDAFVHQQFLLQRQHYRQHYAGAGFWIVERGQTPVGRIYVFRSPSELRLMDVALLPASQRQGIGAALLRALLRQASRSGNAVTLHVEPNNPVNRLYQRLGFRFVTDRGAYHFLRWSPDAAGADDCLS